MVEFAKSEAANVPYTAVVGTLIPAKILVPEDASAVTGIVPGAKADVGKVLMSACV